MELDGRCYFLRLLDVYKRQDKYIVGSLIFTPVLLLGISMLVYWGSVPTPMNITLGHGDYSDGTVSYTHLDVYKRQI